MKLMKSKVTFCMKKFCETFRKTVLEFIEKPSKLTKTERIKKAVWYPRKINDQELYDYVQKNPDKYLREIASHFKVSVMTVQRRLIKMGISRKKNKTL